MAHAVVEWTDNLERDGFQVRPLLELIAAGMRDSGIFPWGGIRVRGVRLTDYVIADGAADDAFINITVKMGSGRPSEVKTEVFNRLFEAIKAHTADLFGRRYLALSLYLEEADEVASFKHNNLHARFRKGN